VPQARLIATALHPYIRVVPTFDREDDMRRYALAPPGPTREPILTAVPRRAAGWTIAPRNRGLHTLLVPIDASLRGLDALRYIVEHCFDHVGGIHVVNVQKPVMAGNVTPLVTAQTITMLRRAAGERVLATAREAFQASGMPLTTELAFGDVAETICRIARERGCSGIVIARNGFELHELLRGSVAARVLRMASVPVTIINARAAEAAAMEAEASPPPAAHAERETEECDAEV
jgi:nucleotide-binding universal stress UspA family protein